MPDLIKIPEEREKEEEEAAAPATKPTGRSKGGRTRRGGRGARDRKLVTKDKGLRALLVLMMKQLSVVSMRSRQVMGVVCDTIILPKSHPVAAAVAAEGISFAQAVGKRNEEVAAAKKSKEGKATKRKDDDEAEADLPPPLGPPGLTNFMAVLETLLKEDIGRANREAISELVDAYNSEHGKTMIEEQVRICRIETTAKDDQIRLLLGIRDVKQRPAVLDAFRQLGHPAKSGCAPAGYMETEISAWIKALEGTIES